MDEGAHRFVLRVAPTLSVHAPSARIALRTDCLDNRCTAFDTVFSAANVALLVGGRNSESEGDGKREWN